MRLFYQPKVTNTMLQAQRLQQEIITISANNEKLTVDADENLELGELLVAR